MLTGLAWERAPAASCGVGEEGEGSRTQGSVARAPRQTGVTPKAQTGNVFPQIPFLLVPEIPPFVIYSIGFSIVFFCFGLLLVSPLYKC